MISTHLPATGDELTEVARAVLEMADRLAVLESVVVDLLATDEPGAAVIGGDVGRGERYVRSRIAAIEAGQFGQEAVDRVLASIAAAKAAAATAGGPPTDANDPFGAKRRDRMRDLQQSGRRVWRPMRRD